MKKLLLISIFYFLSAIANYGVAQCSVCTKTNAQMGEKPAKGMNAGILYLMAAPFIFAGYIGYRWWKTNR